MTVLNALFSLEWALRADRLKNELLEESYMGQAISLLDFEYHKSFSTITTSSHLPSILPWR
ncbi:hypothetical protein ALTERO38_50760 [Alteromonas sp. 38]|nr:hypothetical protein ALTER154_80505 [Alteromonas sp. 154]VXB47260.1 hypothetical protein ALTERO38_50760 [Alteromonas sp. 38]